MAPKLALPAKMAAVGGRSSGIHSTHPKDATSIPLSGSEEIKTSEARGLQEVRTPSFPPSGGDDILESGVVHLDSTGPLVPYSAPLEAPPVRGGGSAQLFSDDFSPQNQNPLNGNRAYSRSASLLVQHSPAISAAAAPQLEANQLNTQASTTVYTQDARLSGVFAPQQNAPPLVAFPQMHTWGRPLSTSRVHPW